MPLNEKQVGYDHPVASEARFYRETLSGLPDLFGNMASGGRCVAVLVFTDGTYMAQMSESSLVAGVGLGYAKHAEQVLIQCFGVEASSKTVKHVYTELQCCGAGSGMRNCRDAMLEFLKNHGVLGESTPVYYSFPYPEGSDQANKLVRSGAVKDLKAAAQSLVS